ncbi:hypothetical protein DSO57_1034942 [Entomophthora muscae]|uniref:Uncharacterized protein n=1 Tax=Entomophthora muscae TaxID=34485 RepID=A0ACC2UL85_9FUNG|nr:hypothetical protein DSO57_1034942 [Entomophthora muscae]
MKFQSIHIAVLSALLSQAAPLTEESQESVIERAKRMVPLVRAINDEFDRVLLDLKHETLNMKLMVSLDGRETDGSEKLIAHEFVEGYLGLKAGHEAFEQDGPPQLGQAGKSDGSVHRTPRDIHAKVIPGEEDFDDDLEPKEIVDKEESTSFSSTAEAAENEESAAKNEETVSEEAIEITTDDIPSEANSEEVEPLSLPKVSENTEDSDISGETEDVSADEETREIHDITETNSDDGLESKVIEEEDPIVSPRVAENAEDSESFIETGDEPLLEETSEIYDEDVISETNANVEIESSDIIEGAEPTALPGVQETTETSVNPSEIEDVSVLEEVENGLNPEDNMEFNEIIEE